MKIGTLIWATIYLIGGIITPLTVSSEPYFRFLCDVLQISFLCSLPYLLGIIIIAEILHRVSLNTKPKTGILSFSSVVLMYLSFVIMFSSVGLHSGIELNIFELDIARFAVIIYLVISIVAPIYWYRKILSDSEKCVKQSRV